MGLGYKVLSEVNSEIIYLSLPSYGNTGPWKDRLGVGRQLDHAVGHSMLRKYPDQEISALSDIYYCDAAVGAVGAFAALDLLQITVYGLLDCHHYRPSL